MMKGRGAEKEPKPHSIGQILGGVRTDSFYYNALQLLFTMFMTSGLGFLFLIFAAMMIPSTAEVGIGTSIISTISLMTVLSRFGFDQSLIRNFPHGDKSTVFSTSLIFTTLIAVLMATVFLLNIGVFAPDLTITLYDGAAIFVIAVACSSILNLTGNCFLALRKTKYKLMQEMLMNLKLLFLFALFSLGAAGILLSFSFSAIIASVVSLALLARYGIKLVIPKKDYFVSTFKFSSGAYIATCLFSAPYLLMPLIVLNALGPATAANYYMAYSIYSVIVMIPTASCTFLLVEGSHEGGTSKTLYKSIRLSLTFLLPIVLVVAIFGRILLGIIGSDYAEGGYDLLLLLSMASIPYTIIQSYTAVLLTHRKIRVNIAINALIFSTHLGFTIWLVSGLGLIGIGYAWLLSYTLVALVVILLLMRQRRSQVRLGREA